MLTQLNDISVGRYDERMSNNGFRFVFFHHNKSVVTESCFLFLCAHFHNSEGLCVVRCRKGDVELSVFCI